MFTLWLFEPSAKKCFNLFFSLASVAGTAEPIYGPEAFHSVAKQESSNPSNQITKEDMRWNVLEATSVETQTFYLSADSGHHGLVQVIYSNVA